MSHRDKAAEALGRAKTYLRDCGIKLPEFSIGFEQSESFPYLGNNYVLSGGGEYHLNLGRLPNGFVRDWFTMHELGHILWAHYKPLRRKHFRSYFGEPTPPRREYENIYKKYSAITPASWRLSWLPGPLRPEGNPSYYAKYGGGEERFCELIGFMYAHADFSSDGPKDLNDLWQVCWEHGLQNMSG